MQNVSAIVLSPCESRAVVPVIQAANEAGIPVITVDIPCNEEDVEILTQVATDNYGGGKLAGEAMIEAAMRPPMPNTTTVEANKATMLAAKLMEYSTWPRNVK